MASDDGVKLKAVVNIMLHCVVRLDSHDGSTEVAIDGKLEIVPTVTLIHDMNNVPQASDAPAIKRVVTDIVLRKAAEVFDPGVDVAGMAPLTSAEMAALLTGGRPDTSARGECQCLDPQPDGKGYCVVCNGVL